MSRSTRRDRRWMELYSWHSRSDMSHLSFTRSGSRRPSRRKFNFGQIMLLQLHVDLPYIVRPRGQYTTWSALAMVKGFDSTPTGESSTSSVDPKTSTSPICRMFRDQKAFRVPFFSPLNHVDPYLLAVRKRKAWKGNDHLRVTSTQLVWSNQLALPLYRHHHDHRPRPKDYRKACTASSTCKVSYRYCLICFVVVDAFHSPYRIGYLPETDSLGKEKWPRGDEKAWKNAMRGLDTGTFDPHLCVCPIHRRWMAQMYLPSPNRSSTTSRPPLLDRHTISTTLVVIRPRRSPFAIICWWVDDLDLDGGLGV